MHRDTLTGGRPHPAVAVAAEDCRQGRLSRREFLSRATALGMTAAGAAALAGLPAPARAQTADTLQPGGTLRVQMLVKEMTEPRLYDWSELANATRGFLEYLVQYETDGSFTPMLLEGWEASDDALSYRLILRQGVQWNTGEPFTAADVARNIEGWCDSTVAGNSMAARFAALVDPATGRARSGGIVVVDDRTVELNLATPDIAVIANMADYPAAITHESFTGGNPYDHGIGTGPFRPVLYETGVRAVLERHPDHVWWGTEVFGGPWLDRVEFLDFGTDPKAWAAAAEAGEVDLLYESLGDFIDVLDAIGWTRSETVTGATVVIRPNQTAELGGRQVYADPRVRRALATAVSNAVCLELGYADRGVVAENHHVCPIHPEYAQIPPPVHDPAAAAALMAEAGLEGFEHELITPDEEWLSDTGNAVAAQLRDAGIPVKRTIMPGATFWRDWTRHAFSTTSWIHRPLGVQIMALAYRSGEAWNETGFSNPEFDRLMAEALSIASATERREVMARIQTIMQEEGVVIQPYWRSLYTHHNGRVANAEKHPQHEIHLHRIGFSA